MKGPEFFDRLRDEFLETVSGRDPVYGYVAGQVVETSADDRPRLNRIRELLKQMAFAAGLASSERRALALALIALRDYGLGTCSTWLSEFSQESAQKKDENEHETIELNVGHVFVDVSRAGADYCDHLKALSLAPRRAPKRTARTIAKKSPRPATPKPLTGDSLIKWRRAAIRDWTAENDSSILGLADRISTTDSAIRGMVRGDPDRYSAAALVRLLKVIGLSREEWQRGHLERRTQKDTA